MGYLICKKCGGYYELQPGESPDDFSDECECGGELIYSDTLEELDEDYNDTAERTDESYLDTVENVNVNEEFVSDVAEDYQGSATESEEELVDKDDDISQKPKGIVEDYISKADDESKRKDLKLFTDVQERINIDGFYKIKGKGAVNSLKILYDGIETGDGRFIKFQDIISVEDISTTSSQQKESGITGIISSNPWLGTSRLTLKIRYDKGEIEIKEVNKSHAKRFVSFVNRKLAK